MRPRSRNAGAVAAEPCAVTILRTAAELGLPGAAAWHCTGELPPAPRLAIVGSRAAHRRVLSVLPSLVAAAAARGFAVVSGGARGIDRAVHEAALAAGVPQLAVLPCGPDRPYPPEHAPLFAAIAAAPGSAVLFAHPPGTAPHRKMFASRNAIVVAAAAAVIVAEAAPRSGSWGTGRLALRRAPTAALVGSPGCAALIAAGARALPDDPASLRGEAEAWLADPRGVAGPTWPAELRWLADALRAAGPRGLALDDLPDPTQACTALLTAELAGLVTLVADRWYASGGPIADAPDLAAGASTAAHAEALRASGSRASCSRTARTRR